MHADDSPVGLVGHDLDHTQGLAGHHRLGINAERHLDLYSIDALCLGLGHGEPYEGRLGTGENHPAVPVLIIFRCFTRNRGGGHPTLLTSRVGEHQATDDIAHGKDMSLAGAAAGVCLDHAVRHGNSGII